MKITGITFELYDNYIWVIESDVNNEAWIVDPGESSKVVSYFQANNLVLAGILLTHHHYDHTWGIAEVIKQLGEVPVVSNSLGPFKGVTHHIGGGIKLRLLVRSLRLSQPLGIAMNILLFIILMRYFVVMYYLPLVAVRLGANLPQ